MQFADPQPNDQQLSVAYTNLYYPTSNNGEPIRFENTPDGTFDQVFESLEARIGRIKGLRLLDYGCGRGSLLKVARQFGLGQVGIERDPHARAVAAELTGAPIYEGVEALLAAEAAAKFDLITLWTVIEHLRCPWAELSQLRNLLRPGGFLLLSTMDIRCLRARIERRRWENYENQTHLFYFDRTSLARAIRGAGFSEFSEWRLKIRHAHHGPLRRWAHTASFSLGLSDGLYFLCVGGQESARAVDGERRNAEPRLSERLLQRVESRS